MLHIFNRWFLWIILLGTLVALTGAILWDSRVRDQQSFDDTIAMESQVDEAGTRELDDTDNRRVSYVRSVLDTLQHDRARLPYYGELIRIYSDSGFYFEAAGFAEKRAEATGRSGDWKEAAGLYFDVVRQNRDEEIANRSARKAESMYIKALDYRPGDPDLKTDLAVVYMSLLKPEKSYEILNKVLENYPDHLRANFNIGVLLHQMGNADQSIAFFDRSLELAADPEWKTLVQDYLDRHHHELHH